MGDARKHISPELLIELSGTVHKLRLVDVRKRLAFESSGEMIPGAVWREHQAVDSWGASLEPDATVIVYCVHGHEISQTVVTSLLSHGIDARYLQGGFEAWLVAGGGVVKLTHFVDDGEE